MTLATELGRALGVPMRLASLAMEEMTEALNRAWGERDSRAPMEWMPGGVIAPLLPRLSCER